MLTIVADESVDAPIIDALRAAGWDVWSVSEECPSVNDDAVLAAARLRNAILITMDCDFGELVFEGDQPTPAAVIFVRNQNLSLIRATTLILDVMTADNCVGFYTTITRTSIRQRALPLRSLT